MKNVLPIVLLITCALPMSAQVMPEASSSSEHTIPAQAEVETKESTPEPISLSLPSDIFWLPIGDEEIQSQVEEDAEDGIALSHLWFRARLANKDELFLRTLRQQMEAQPENVTVQAAFVRAVLPLSAGMTFGGVKIRPSLTQQFSDVNLGLLIKKGKRKDPKCWLMSVAESEWLPFSGTGNLKTIRTDAANAARRAYELQANPITMKQLAWALVAQGSSERKPEVLPEVQSLIELSQKLYPWSPEANTSLFQMYAYVYKFQDAEKAANAKEQLISTIPEKLRNTKPILDYLNWIQWDKR